MRVIKLRAWDGLQKQMRPWSGTILDPDIIVQKDGTLQHYFGTKHIVLMQATGFKDNNKKEIYEGDIISCIGGYELGESEAPAVVKWNEDTLQWDADSEGDAIPLWEFDIREVIGNIYANPDLLNAAS